MFIYHQFQEYVRALRYLYSDKEKSYAKLNIAKMNRADGFDE